MTCPNCKSTYENEISTCSTCGYPFNGMENEKSLFIAQQIIKVGHIDEGRKSLRGAKIILFVIGTLHIISSILIIIPPVALGISISIGLVFIVFGFLIDKRPFLFLVIPTVLLFLLYLGELLIDPYILMKGVVWKAIYMGALVYGIIRVKRAQKIKSESKYLSQQ